MHAQEKHTFLTKVRNALESLSQDSRFGYYRLDSSCYTVAVPQENRDSIIGCVVKEASDISAPISIGTAGYNSASFRSVGEMLQHDCDNATPDRRDLDGRKMENETQVEMGSACSERRNVNDSANEEEDSLSCVSSKLDNVIIFPSLSNEQADSLHVERAFLDVMTDGTKNYDIVPDVFGLVCDPSLERHYPV